MVNKDARDTDSKDGREIGLVELRRSVLTLITANLVVLGGLLGAHATPMVTLIERQPFLIFESQVANSVAMPIFGLVGGFMVLVSLYDVYKEWARVTPAPALLNS